MKMVYKKLLSIIILLFVFSLASPVFADTISSLKKSCDGGYASGCSFLGHMYQQGDGVKQDYFKAKALYSKACYLKNELSCKSYARLNK